MWRHSACVDMSCTGPNYDSVENLGQYWTCPHVFGMLSIIVPDEALRADRPMMAAAKDCSLRRILWP